MLGAQLITRRPDGHARKIPDKCSDCGEPFMANEQIVSHRQSARNGRTRRYLHKQCYEKKFYDSSITDSEIDKDIAELETLQREERQRVEALKRTYM